MEELKLKDCFCIKDYIREHFGKLFEKNQSYKYEVINEDSHYYYIVYDNNSELSKCVYNKNKFNEYFKIIA
jgi:hypothetical protein